MCVCTTAKYHRNNCTRADTKINRHMYKYRNHSPNAVAPLVFQVLVSPLRALARVLDLESEANAGGGWGRIYVGKVMV